MKREFSIFLAFVSFLLILFYTVYFIFSFDIVFNLDIIIPILILSFLSQRLRLNHHYRELGLSLDKNVVQNSFFTLVIATIAIIFSALMLLMKAGGIDETRFISNFNLQIVFNILSLVVIEELVFRGLAFQIIEENLGKISALLLSSLLFSIAHLFNPAVSYFAHINIFLAGILFGILYIKSRSLYPPIIFHFVWNFSSIYILNSPLSGKDMKMGLINSEFEFNYGFSEVFFGGNFGIEESILTTMILIFSIILSIKLLVENPYINSIYFKRKFSKV